MWLEEHGVLVSQPMARARTILGSYGSKKIYFFAVLVAVMIITFWTDLAFLVHNATVEYDENEAIRSRQHHHYSPREQAANSTLGVRPPIIIPFIPPVMPWAR